MARAKYKADGLSVPDDYVPVDYSDLHRTYRSFVARLVTRYNRVTSNYEDLHQHVWLKILESDLIAKYHLSGSSPPKKMTADQACEYLGIRWGAFKIAVCRGVYGREKSITRASKEVASQVFERDHGVCCYCGIDTERLRQGLEKLRSDPSTSEAYRRSIQLLKDKGVSPRHRVFWSTERAEGTTGGNSVSDYRTVCCFCQRARSNRSTSELRAQLYDRDHGICCHCGRDLEKLKVGLELLRGKPESYLYRANMIRAKGVDPEKKSFWFPEQIEKGAGGLGGYRTSCCFCTKELMGVVRLKDWAPTPIRGSWASRKAVYSRRDIERFRELRLERSRKRGEEPPPPPVLHSATRAPFKMYLATSVHNTYANWCRTRDRKCKESYPGVDTETGRSWEETLEDPIGPQQENLLALYEAVKVIAHDQGSSEKEELSTEIEVLALLAEGLTPAEIVQKLDLPRHVLQILAREA